MLVLTAMSYRVKKYLPFEARLNVVVQRIIENGMMSEFEHFNLNLIRLSSMISTYHRYNDNATIAHDINTFLLTIDHLGMLYIYYCGIMFASIVIFLGELFYFKRNHALQKNKIRKMHLHFKCRNIKK